MRPRFTIFTLLGLVGVFGVIFVALRSPSPLWAWTFFGLALVSLAASLVGSVFARGRRRAYWGGYAAFGWAYFAAVFAPGLGEAIGPWFPTTPAIAALNRSVEPPFLTVMDEVALLKSYLEGESPAVRGPSWMRPDRFTGAEFSRVSPLGTTIVPPRTFRVICHSMLTLLFASLGGAYARRRYDQRRLIEAPPAPGGTLAFGQTVE
jgi:hypothetical protein